MQGRCPDRRGSAGLAALVAIALLVLFAVPAPSSGAAGTVGEVRGAVNVSNDTPFIQHVVVVVLENELLSQVYAHGPYERYLADVYGNATSMYAACHPSAPNYLAMVAGVVNQCGSDTWHNYTNKTIFSEFDRSGLTWGSYAENLPAKACSNPGGVTAGLFATRHVPALWFTSVNTNQTYCRSHVVGANVFNSSVAAGTLRNFSFYTPNLCDDGHDGCGLNTTNGQLTRQADSWLKNWLTPMLNHTGRFSGSKEQAMINHTAFLISWDEGNSGLIGGFPVAGVTSGDNLQWCGQHGATGDAVCGGHIFLSIVSPFSLDRTMTANDSTYGWDHTVEWLFHIAPLGNPGGFDNLKGFPAMSALFNFTANT